MGADGIAKCREIYLKILNVLSKSSQSVRYRKMEAVTGMWTELQKDNKLPKGSFMSNCERELQDLMKQIDVMVASKKREWEREREGLQSRLQVREKECLMQKSTLEQKHKEIGTLRQQLDSVEKKQRENISQYESQLAQLRAEVQKLQREYERLHKRHTKHKKEAERDKEKSVLEVQDSMAEVQRLSKKVEDYKLRSRDWEIERRAQSKQIDNLEAQRKAIAEKCEFVQQQSQTYQTQLDKRRELLDSTEISLNSQIVQLEGKLTSTSESLRIQTNKVEKLKTSLDEAMKSHKKAMDDNEKLLLDLKKANMQLRKTEEQNAELQLELRARDDFLHMSEEDSKQHARDFTLFEKQIAEKDKIIRSLSDTRQQSETEEILQLRQSLAAVEEQARTSRRNEQLLLAERDQFESELGTKKKDNDSLKTRLDQKKSDVARLEKELQSIKSQLMSAQNKLSSMTGTHEAEVLGMKEQLSRVTTELHNNNTSVGTLNEKTTELEKELGTEREELGKKDAELKVANAQIDALRLENKHLRQTIIQQTQFNLDHTETESHLRGIQESYQNTIKSLEQENTALKDEVNVLQQEIRAMEDRYDDQLQHTIHEAEMSQREEQTKQQRHIQEVEEDSQRRCGMLQDRLDSTIHRYEEQLQLLRRQKVRLEDDLRQERQRAELSGSFVHPGAVVYEDEHGVMYVNDDMSLTGTNSVGDEDEFAHEMADVGEAASEKFLIEESLRTRELESLIDNHIEQLKSATDATIKHKLNR